MIVLTTSVILVVVIKVLLWDAAIVNRVAIVEVLVIDELTNVGIIVVGAIVIALTFVVPVSYAVGDVAGKLFMDALTDAMLDVLTKIGSDVLAGASVNVCAVAVIAVEFRACPSLEEFSR